VDGLDGLNHYLIARENGRMVGFVSLTPPSAGKYSIDKYFSRPELPFTVDGKLWEIRLLTVLPAWRHQPVAVLLMYAAFRFAESHGGVGITGIGRQEVLPIYLKSGMEACGPEVTSGRVHYHLLHSTVERMRQQLDADEDARPRYLEGRVHWRLAFPFRKPVACFHGGAFFSAIGEDFSTLEKRHGIINADVLDAWFPPAPSVLESLTADLPWLLRTSPPTDCAGLIREIAAARGVMSENILPGAGSSDLIFRAFLHWLNRKSRVLILEPTYGEYAHVLEKVVHCQVYRLLLRAKNGFLPALEELRTALCSGYDLVVLVNPNSPTGRHVAKHDLEALLRSTPVQTRIWIDETYVDYAGAGQSLEAFAAASENVIVCKSMSKVYALSGARVAYLCAGAHQLECLRAITPPWVVGLPTQLAAVRALQSASYYLDRYAETHELRKAMAEEISRMGITVLPSIANFLLCLLPPDGPTAEKVVLHCRSHGVFLRDAKKMGSNLGEYALRVAVKSAAENQTILAALEKALFDSGGYLSGSPRRQAYDYGGAFAGHTI
jgi:histidinol-phosphate/aromatic aminotransferase/cobyric acid decarboxylase-like protein/GNAT superfamily N-acetyltransferase